VRRQKENKAVQAVSTVVVPDFRGQRKLFWKYGHIERDSSGKYMTRCIEWKDATTKEREIKELNSGAYCFDAAWLWQSLPKLKKKNVSGEYYLTDLMGLGVAEGERVLPVPLKHWSEGLGANTLEDIRVAEHILK
jgi:bifunctional UDP-N-acetylglucosamine pyrophosphorylase/glucosamine-1-phosphate N-acetyltransferase